MEKEMSGPTILTDKFDRALLYATHVHGGQVRKKTTIPYVAHLLAVAATVIEYGGSEDMAIAGLLHDAVEDQGGKPRLSDIRHRFGETVARIVESCSDSSSNVAHGEVKAPWLERKRKYLEKLRTVDNDVILVSLADKVHNARSILRDLRNPEVGERVWQRFTPDKADTIEYYRLLSVEFLERRGKTDQLANELAHLARQLKR
jgi:(p)ppGpp synthase/HD superfamily hydrolase